MDEHLKEKIFNVLRIFSIIYSPILFFVSSLTSGFLTSYPIIKFLIYSDWDKFNFEESLFKINFSSSLKNTLTLLL